MNFLTKSIEPLLHIVFWLFYFTSINVAWFGDWFDASIRTNTPSPLSVLIFPIFFYANAFWLIPKYLNRKDWPKYLVMSALVFLAPELIRIIITENYKEGISYNQELFSRDSFLFGAPSPFFIAINSSFIYRFAKDWFRNRRKIEELSKTNNKRRSTKPYENAMPLSEKEATRILSQLNNKMTMDSLFLDPKLSLRSLAATVKTTDKKLSFVLNQSLSSNFYDYVNKFRVECFKKRLAEGDSEKLSLVGLALECGFKSKSSFYRAFKSEVGCSPSEYLKKLS